jgi:lambda repressor-like predicted transcriptional regulator
VSAPHGTNARYVTHRCRCADCRRASAADAAWRRRQHGYGRPRLVDPEQTQTHVRALQTRGMSLTSIDQAAEFVRGTVSRILYLGERRIRRDTEARILAITPPSPSPGRGDPTVGARRRLQALACHGWPLNWITAEAGVSRTSLVRALNGHSVRAVTAEAVSTTYERLWNAAPPQRTPRQQAAVTTARQLARDSGWAPPMAWDDEQLDDPNARPVGVAHCGAARVPHEARRAAA